MCTVGSDGERERQQRRIVPFLGGRERLAGGLLARGEIAAIVLREAQPQKHGGSERRLVADVLERLGDDAGRRFDVVLEPHPEQQCAHAPRALQIRCEQPVEPRNRISGSAGVGEVRRHRELAIAGARDIGLRRQARRLLRQLGGRLRGAPCVRACSGVLEDGRDLGVRLCRGEREMARPLLQVLRDSGEVGVNSAAP